MSTVSVTAGVPCGRPQRARAFATPGTAEDFALEVAQADKAAEALDRAGRRVAGVIAALGLGAARDDPRQVYLVEPIEALLGFGLGLRLDRAIAPNARAVARHDVVHAGGEAPSRLAVAELDVALARVVLADDVNLLGRAVPEEARHARPSAVLDVDLEFGCHRGRLASFEVVGQRCLREREGLEGLAAVAVAEDGLTLGVPLVGLGEVAVDHDRGLVNREVGRDEGCGELRCKRERPQPLASARSSEVDLSRGFGNAAVGMDQQEATLFKLRVRFARAEERESRSCSTGSSVRHS